MSAPSINWQNLKANSAASLALYLNHELKNVRKDNLAHGQPEICEYQGKTMRVSEARSRMIALVESARNAHHVGAAD